MCTRLLVRIALFGAFLGALNLHRARVRRNRARLPSSRCIESAPEHHGSILILLLMRASDTALGLQDRSSCRRGAFFSIIFQ